MEPKQTDEALHKRVSELENELARHKDKGKQELLKSQSDCEKRAEERAAELKRANVQLMRQIEERRLAEAALRVSKERFDLAVRGSKDGLWDWNITNNKIYFSPRLKELLGYRNNEFSESFDTWISNIHPQDYGRVLNALNAHLKEGKVYDIEYLCRYMDAQYRWYHSRGQAIYDQEGRMRIRQTHDSHRPFRRSSFQWSPPGFPD